MKTIFIFRNYIESFAFVGLTFNMLKSVPFQLFERLSNFQNAPPSFIQPVIPHKSSESDVNAAFRRVIEMVLILIHIFFGVT